jgi:alcohol dehydrogenase (cytochrome c)
MLFRGIEDGRVLAYDFETGRRIWETTIADVKHGESVPAAPIASDGLVFVGNAGGDMKDGKGHMFALDAKTGKIVWEFFLVPVREGDTIRGPLGKTPLNTSTWKNAPGIPISGGGTWTSYTLDPTPACSTFPAAIRRPISRSPRARGTTFILTRSSCSTPEPGTTSTISSLFARIGTTGTSPIRPS